MTQYDQLHPPLMPAGVSLDGNDWFPLYFDRLRKSRWWRRASDLARARNVMLWGEAYKATPAGSLPDDDDDLAEAAGFAMDDVGSFLAVKAEIMAPWILCSDGRWYHPTVCEQALDAWERTSVARRKEREKKARQRAAVRSGVPRDIALVPGDTAENPGDLAHRQTGQDKTQQPVASALPLATVSAPNRREVLPTEPWANDADFLALWNASTAEMRRRAKSKRKAWGEWRKVRGDLGPGDGLRSLKAYLKGDPDVQRTGGPGLHIWLRDRTFEIWASEDGRPAETWTSERWDIACEQWQRTGGWGETMGPPPGQPGCRAPQTALAKIGLGLRVVGE